MIHLATNKIGVNKVVIAKVIPIDGMAEKIKDLFQELLGKDTDYLPLRFSSSHSVYHYANKTMDLFDPALRYFSQFTGLGEKVKRGSKYVCCSGKEALFTDRILISKYAASIRLLFETLYGDWGYSQTLSDMLTDDFSFGTSHIRKEDGLGDLNGWYSALYHNCPDFTLFCNTIGSLISFEQSGLPKKFTIHEKAYLNNLTEEIIVGQNNMSILRLVKKVPGFMGIEE